MPRCMFHTLTGWECPGCGSQRLLHALLHGDVAGAWRANAFLLLSLPYIALLGAVTLWPRRWPRLHRRLNSPLGVTLAAAAIAAWGVARNLL